MSPRIRLIILSLCAVLFFTATPYIILYSLGYRIDFAKMKITATGGIYVKALPEGTEVVIDFKMNNKTGILSNAVFVQNLFPEQHNVLIKKEGYHDYKKNLTVKKNQVIKLENVILFKKNINFNLFEDQVDKFFISPDGKKLFFLKYLNAEKSKKTDVGIVNLENQKKQFFAFSPVNGEISNIQWSNDSNKVLFYKENSYFLLEPFGLKPEITNLLFLNDAKKVSFNPQNNNQFFFIKNKNLYADTQNLPIVKNVIDYQITNQEINWLSDDGFLYHTDLSGKIRDKISSSGIPVKKNSFYKISIFSGQIFLEEDQSLYLFNQDSKIFENFYRPVTSFKISPAGEKILYCNNNEVSYHFFEQNDLKKILSQNTLQEISDCSWLNDDYLIFISGNNIIISETDTRDNTNKIKLPDSLSLPNGENINIKKPHLIFNQRDKKLYILTQKNLFVSERLTP